MDIFLQIFLGWIFFSTIAVTAAFLWWQDNAHATGVILFLGVLFLVVTLLSQKVFEERLFFWLTLSLFSGVTFSSLIGGILGFFFKKAFEKLFWVAAVATSATILFTAFWAVKELFLFL